ncbi:hypothetical protein GPROT1_00269 [Gammaproteobacteria bacterium]|nr:hypothetical protein GPROT1_00269 [Gammaproteobacteria bacterium]
MIFVDAWDWKEPARQAVLGIAGPAAINAVEGGRTPPDSGFAEMQAI